MKGLAEYYFLNNVCSLGCDRIEQRCERNVEMPNNNFKTLYQKYSLRSDAVPAVTFILAILEYCARALAR